MLGKQVESFSSMEIEQKNKVVPEWMYSANKNVVVRHPNKIAILKQQQTL